MIPVSCRWERREIDETAAKQLAQELDIPLLFARLLAGRGICTAREAVTFLDSPVSEMYDPFLMKGMTAAVTRILRALEDHEKITIYGDYDVDGMTAVSILLLFFESLGANAAYYIPDRMKEGYGMNDEAVRKIAADGTGLIITVDTGISSSGPCALAASLGLDVIVTDHHECPEILPDAVAVIDIKQPGETYPFQALAGCGTAFKLVQALAGRLGCEQEVMRYTELAAVGTVADIVPLLDENRLIVAEGFRRLKNPENIGVKKLLEVSGWNAGKGITGDMIGFGVGPRLNACGRLGSASEGVRLLTTDDEEEAGFLAADMNAKNAQRKEIEQYILFQVQEQIESSPALRSDLVIVAEGENWHHGVIGIVSSRIKDRYYRPNILLSVENGLAVGSARSIDGFNLYDALTACKDLLIKYGGHEAAAGMTLKAEDVPALRERINVWAAEHMTPEMLTPSLMPELSLTPSDITLDLIRSISRMEPFGKDMPQPLVEVSGILGEIRRIGKDGGTLRATLRDEKGALTGVGFRKADYADYYIPGTPAAAVGSLAINVFRDEESPQIMIEDIHGQMADELRHILDLFRLRTTSRAFAEYCLALGRPGKDSCAKSYVFLRNHAARQGNPEEGRLSMEYFAADCGASAHSALVKLLLSCEVFEELGLLEVEVSGPYMHYRLVPGRQAALTDSRRFREAFQG
jgi:single-stranded-DNA-specific exonuclease